MSGIKISAVDLKGLAAPITKLIEVLSNTAGVLYEPTRIRRKAKANSDIEIIKAETDIKLSDLQQRSFARLIEEEVKKQDRIESIIERAIPLMTDDSKPENIDPDWLLLFIEKSKNISSEQMQLIWANVLAGESNNSGSFSKRTLAFLSTIDKKDADLFTSLCNYTIVADIIYPIIDEKENIYKTTGLTFDNLSHLDDIGLIKFDGLGAYQANEIDTGTPVLYFGREIPNVIKEGANEFDLGSCLYSNVGKELFSISGAAFDDAIYQYLVKRYA